MAEMRVKELMVPLKDYAVVTEDATLEDAIVALQHAQSTVAVGRHHHRAVLVLDGNGEVTGKLSYWAILCSLDHRLFSNEDRRHLLRAGFTSEFIDDMEEHADEMSCRSLEYLYGVARRIKVTEAAVSAGERLDEGAPLSVAIHRFVTTHSQSVLVTSTGKVVGILRLSDVFAEVANAVCQQSTRDACEPDQCIGSART